MLKRLLETEVAAATVDEAVLAAISLFGCSRAEVETTILQTPDRGLLRLFRRRSARVHVRLHDRAFIARRIADHLLHMVGISGRVGVLLDKRQIRLHIECSHPGLVIGRRGQNIGALQTLVGMLVDRVSEERTPIVLTVGEGHSSLPSTFDLSSLGRRSIESSPVNFDPLLLSPSVVLHSGRESTHQSRCSERVSDKRIFSGSP